MEKKHLLEMLKSLEDYAIISVALCEAKINNCDSEYIQELEKKSFLASEKLEAIKYGLDQSSLSRKSDGKQIFYNTPEKVH